MVIKFKVKDNLSIKENLNSLGYLVSSSKLAHSRPMEYKGETFGVNKEKVTVITPESELFSADAIKSFEGVPVTFLHPPEDVDANNWKEFAIGHLQNVKRVNDELCGDVIINDGDSIKAIKEYGIKELSLAYDVEEIRESDEEGVDLEKIGIRGNHVAVVLKGRAGAKYRIIDKKEGFDYMNKKTKSNLYNKIISKLNSIRGNVKKIQDGSDAEGSESDNKVINQVADIVEVLVEQAEEAKQAIEQSQQQESVEDEDDKKKENEGGTEDSELLIKLREEISKKDEEIESLKEELEDLKNEVEKNETIKDASDIGMKVKDASDIKTARDFKATVLVENGIYTEKQVTKIADEAIDAAYTVLRTQFKKESKNRLPNIGSIFSIKDSSENKVSANELLGGKRKEK